MKRLLILLCVVGLLAALPMSHLALAGKPEAKPAKVKLCHITNVEYDVDDNVVLEEGHVIHVSVNAEPAHRAHGDYGGNPDIPGDVLGLSKEAGDYCSRP